MAQKVRIILEDDLDGGPADETIRFGLRLTATRFLTVVASTRMFRMHTTKQ